MRKILVIILLHFTADIFCQSGIIRGTVADKETQEPIIGCSVMIRSLNISAITDEEGKFELLNLPSGKYLIESIHPGYLQFTDSVEVSNKPFLFNILLNANPAIEDNSLIEAQYKSEITVEATRATTKTPIAYSEISSKEIAPLNNGQDIPYLLRFTPSLVSTSDAGNGIGYTGLWIRGSDPSRVNVTVNGVPLNDPESQQVFWVNNPDLASSASSVQIQRGIGTSTNGAGSFGGSIKIETRDMRTKPYAESSNVFGSFNSLKNNLSFGTGLMHEHFSIEGRVSQISSDGYIDRAATTLKSYFLETAYIDQNTTIKFTKFGGHEQTYQSWNGTPISVLSGNKDSIADFAIRNGFNESQTNNALNSGRTYNYYQYKNQIDNYDQNHNQLHLSQQLSEHWKLNATAHFTHGEGYFEEYKDNQELSGYGISPIQLDSLTTITSTNLIRRRWLKNDFYGVVGSIIYQTKNWESIFGVAANEYDGKHFGELTWMQFAGNTNKDDHYYNGKSMKKDANAYWKNTVTIFNRLDLFGDIQVRNVNYATSGTDNDLRNYDINDHLLFINPKAGWNYHFLNKQRIYGSIAFAGKEPNRNDYVDAQNPDTVKPEYMTDLELGYRYTNKTSSMGVNLYFMSYKNQLVLTGELNDVGAPLRTNVDRSFRRGIELDFSKNFLKDLHFASNLTLSENKIQNFKETLYDYTVDYSVIEIAHSNTDIAFSPSVIGSAQLSYTLWDKKHINSLEVAGMFKYVGKQFLDNTQNDRLSIDPYSLGDMRISCNTKPGNKLSLQLNFTVNNILNTLYSSNGYTYSYVYGSRVTEIFYYPQAGRTYSFGIKITI